MFNDNTNPNYPRHPGGLKVHEDVRRVIDGYDCGIRYMDEHIGRVLQALADQGVADDLAIIVSADHGENLGELGNYGEHGTADDVTCRIPMIVKWPGCKSGHVDTGFHYNLDLAPTLADLFGQPARDAWDGKSYASAIVKGEDCGWDFLVLSQCAHVCQRGVRFGRWMYIRTYHDGYHLFPDEMLFDIEKDPHEQHNTAEQNPDICMKAVYFLNQWHDNMMKTMDSDADPLWTVIREGGPYHARGHLKEYCSWLEKTGRGHAVPELKKRHPGEFK
jgi:arylsulfatase A-like enzyme